MRFDEKADARWFRRVILTAAVLVLFGYGVLWLVGLWLRPYREIDRSVRCRSNVHMISRGFALYSDDYEGRYMPAHQWELAVEPYVEPRYRACPVVEGNAAGATGYAANKAASGKDSSLIDRPEVFPLLFDSDRLERNAADSPDNLPKPGRHITRSRKEQRYPRGNWIGYADGSARIKLDAPADRSEP